MEYNMTLFIIFVFLALFLWARARSRKYNRETQEQEMELPRWEPDKEAVYRADISGLDYIKIPLEALPFTDTVESSLLALQNTVKALAGSSILNLTGLTNTDLKLTYGIANLTFLADCRKNFILLADTLYQWGRSLYEAGKLPEALQVLEYAASCKTGITENYLLLAKIYRRNNVPEKIDDLTAAVKTLKAPDPALLPALKEIKESIYPV